MNFSHFFILLPNAWLGEGVIQLNMVEDQMGYFTRWTIGSKDHEGKIECLQEIQIKGIAETTVNRFLFSKFTPKGFVVELENEALGKIQGKGVIDDKVIAWEFRDPDIGFEGLEFYEKQSDTEYLMKAEYATADQFRTNIQGKVWLAKQPQKVL